MRTLLTVIFALALTAPVAAQHRLGHDPLNPKEADQLRDTALEPVERLKLYVTFARARMTSIDQVLADPKAKDKAKQLHDLLEDFATLADEIADNVDTYHGEHWDIRKSLKLVIEADSEFKLKLRKLAESATDPKLSAEAEPYKFVLQDAIESLNNSADDARHIMQEQNDLAKAKKLKKEDDTEGRSPSPSVPQN